MHYLANVPGLEHFLAKDPVPSPHPPPSKHMQYLAKVPLLEHFLAKNPPPAGMSTFWLTSARYAIDIRIASFQVFFWKGKTRNFLLCGGVQLFMEVFGRVLRKYIL